MKKTIYKRLRLGGILLCMMLIAGCIAPLSAYAAGTTAVAEQDSVHFINPTAITVVGDYLYVADVVEDNKTAILCFDISETTPILTYTYDEIDGVVSGLTSNKQNVIYLNMSNKVVELNISAGLLPTIGKTYAMPQAAPSIIDVAYGKIINSADKTLYALTDTTLYQYNESSQLFDIELVRSLNGAKAVLSIDEAPNYQLYYLSGVDTPLCNRMNLSNGGQDSGFADKLKLINGLAPTSMLRINDEIALYNSDSIYVIDEGVSFATIRPLLTLSSLYASDCLICDVESYGDRLFILNSKNKIDVFDTTEEAYNNQPTTTIGSDMVDKKVPTTYTSFTLAQPNGYPANIVYKTKESSSIEDIITDASEYVVLGYEGDNESHYYYVMVGDKFGWVKKSDGATGAANDSKLTIVNNNLNQGTFAYEAKFTSLNGVYVYNLPLSTANYTAITQTASTMKTVTVLQEFKEGETTWYYVSYDEGKTGFVKSSDVGKFHIVSTTEQVQTLGLKKINSSLFAPVEAYKTEEMLEGDFAIDYKDDEIKLYSGDRVTLVKEENGSALIMILHNNGERDFGWIDASKLIDVHKITTNAVVGLVLLAVAIALAAILLIVYFKRRKRIRANKD